MNKIEYLNSLKEALKDTDESVMEEIVSDYEEHFQVGAEKGKSEEQICDEMGSIDDLVDEIKEVYNTGNKEKNKADNNQTNSENKKSNERRFNIPNIDSEKIGSAINSALDSAGEAISKIDVIEIGHSLKNTLNQASSSINNFTDTYLRNSVNFSRRNTEGSNENVTKSYEAGEEPENTGKSNVSYDAETVAQNTDEDPDIPVTEAADCAQADTELNTEESAVKQETSGEESEADNVKDTNAGLKLILNGECADVNVVKSSNNKINISYENNGSQKQKQMYEFYSYKDGNTVYAGIHRVGKAVFLFNINQNSININVEIPENMSAVDLKTASGDIRIVDVKTDRIIVAAASGEVFINQVSSTDLRIKGSSGDIRLEEVSCIKLSAGTSSGDIRADNIDTKYLTLKSSSGDVKARNLRADIIDNSTSSGDQDLSNVNVRECKFRSTGGDIDIDEINMNNADISSISGKIKIPKIVGDGLRASSSSGNITLNVKVKRCHASSKSGNVEVKCEGDTILESNSISGNINIILKNSGNGYCIESRTTSGELNIKYNNMSQSNLRTGTYTYGKQESELTVSTVSGDIRLTD